MPDVHRCVHVRVFVFWYVFEIAVGMTIIRGPAASLGPLLPTSRSSFKVRTFRPATGEPVRSLKVNRETI